MGGSQGRQGEEEAGEGSIDSMLGSLRLDPTAAAKLYLHVGGFSPAARWVLADKLASYSFTRPGDRSKWALVVGSKVRAEVGPAMQLKPFPSQRRADLVADAVWALKFPSDKAYKLFYNRFQDCLFENTHGLAATNENKLKIYGT